MAENTFVPFVVEENDMAALRRFIDEIPMKYGLQVLLWMEQLEQKAVALKSIGQKPDMDSP